MFVVRERESFFKILCKKINKWYILSYTYQANYNVYKSERSRTFKENGTAFFIGYEDGGEVVGTLVKDTVRIGAMTIKNQTFAQATSFPTKQIYDGILGLGFVSNANSRASTVLDNLFDQKQISEKVFSFYLNRYIYIYGSHSN